MVIIMCCALWPGWPILGTEHTLIKPIGGLGGVHQSSAITTLQHRIYSTLHLYLATHKLHVGFLRVRGIFTNYPQLIRFMLDTQMYRQMHLHIYVANGYLARVEDRNYVVASKARQQQSNGGGSRSRGKPGVWWAIRWWARRLPGESRVRSRSTCLTVKSSSLSKTIWSPADAQFSPESSGFHRQVTRRLQFELVPITCHPDCPNQIAQIGC